MRPIPSRATFQCGSPRMLLPEKRHRALIRHEMSSHRVEQRRLAGTVRPDQRRDDAGAQGERHVVHGFQAAEGFADVVGLKQDLAGHGSPLFRLSDP